MIPMVPYINGTIFPSGCAVFTLRPHGVVGFKCPLGEPHRLSEYLEGFIKVKKSIGDAKTAVSDHQSWMETRGEVDMAL